MAEEPVWPDAEKRRVVFLLDVAGRLEARELEDWIARHRPEGAEAEVVTIPSTRRPGRNRELGRLETVLAEGDDPLFAPLRVAWLAPSREDGRRVATLRDLVFRLSDPRDPGALRQRLVRARHPDRCRIVAGEPAPLKELRARWRAAGGADGSDTSGLAEFVVRQAGLALERAERRVRGNRYKVPRLVEDHAVSRPAFRGGVARLARSLGRSEASVMKEALADLREIAAAHTPTMIDVAAQIFRFMSGKGYQGLRYDRSQLEGVAALGQQHPIVFLPTHKSNLDHPSLSLALYENELPQTHTAGGINMNFFPLGAIFRRAGVFFIRRSFKDDEIYKFVLQHYIDYLIEKRFSLEWYVEGGRSRSGKLLPPRFGLLAYVVDSYRRGKAEDVYLIPTSIAYDQIQDVGDYVAEQRGARKQAESFAWFLRLVRGLNERFGEIHIRFGEPISLAKVIGPPTPHAEPQPDEQSLAIQKLAFEVCVRINRVTPITPTSLVTLALLGFGDRAVTLEELHRSLEGLVHYVEHHHLPVSAPLELGSAEGIRRTLESLRESGVVTCFAEGPEAVYAIGPDQHLTASYYRNAIAHFFVNGAIAELALLKAAEGEVEDRRGVLIEETLRLRDLLKFEFFFAERELFRAEIRNEIAGHDPQWKERLGSPAEIYALVGRFRPLAAHRVLRPFLEAYRVVADSLTRLGPDEPLDETRFLSGCLGLGRQYTLQRRIRSPESVSKALFQTALRLARNRDLLEPGRPDLAERRRALAQQLDDTIRRIDAVEAIAAARRSGVLASP